MIKQILLDDAFTCIVLNKLRDGRAFTANELAKAANISTGQVTEVLDQLQAKVIVRSMKYGRFVYYLLEPSKVDEVNRRLAQHGIKAVERPDPTGMKYCRSCHGHLAGLVGVKFRKALEAQGYIYPQKAGYGVTKTAGIG